MADDRVPKKRDREAYQYHDQQRVHDNQTHQQDYYKRQRTEHGAVPARGGGGGLLDTPGQPLLQQQPPQHRPAQHYQPRPQQQRGPSLKDICDLETRPDNVFVRGAEQQSISLAQWRQQNAVLASDPRIELLRMRHVRNLREEYDRLCPQYVGIQTPKESLNRWLFEQRTQDSELEDPLLPAYREDKPISAALKYEIMESIPSRLNLAPKDDRKALQELQRFAQQSRALLVLRNPETREQILKQQEISDISRVINEVDSWRMDIERRREQPSLDVLTEKAKLLKDSVVDPLKRRLEPLVDLLCIRLAKSSQQKLQELLNEAARIRAQPVSSTVAVFETSRDVKLSCDGHDVYVSPLHLSKLYALYSLHKGVEARQYDKHRDMDFNRTVFSLLVRYETFFGNVNRFEGTGFQAALPPSTFRVLSKELGVVAECFASPLNCYYSNFCSAFRDTDANFGSMGSFFDFNPTQGSFEANPPFTIEVMDEMVTHIEQLLEASNDALSFAVFVPTWSDARPLIRMDESKWLSTKIIVEADKHTYVSGSQYKTEAPSSRGRQGSVTTGNGVQLYTAIHATTVYFLQNEKGKETYKVTPERIEMIRRSFAGM